MPPPRTMADYRGRRIQARPPPKNWTPGSPPPPPPPRPDRTASRASPRSRLRAERRGPPKSPGLVRTEQNDLYERKGKTWVLSDKPASRTNPRRTGNLLSPYMQEAVAIKIREKREAEALKMAYKPPEKKKGAPKPRRNFELDDIHLKTLRTIFTLLDSDQDKLLTVKELRHAIIAMGIPPAPRLIKEILDNVPSWAGEGVDFETFKSVITDRLKSNPVHMADIEEVFKVFEQPDGRGYITAKNLRHVMVKVETSNKTNLSEEEVNELFAELGYGAGKHLDYKKFLADISSGFVNFE